MTFGFVGTGTITEAIIRGMRGAGMSEPIVVSPRNSEIAARLAANLADVSIAGDNQGVVDRADTVVLAVRPQIVQQVVGELHFRAEQTVVSLVATLGIKELAEMVAPASSLVRAVPLPFVEHRLGPTLVYPPHAEIAALFDRLGKAIVLSEESQIDVMTVASSTMGSYFATMGWITDWLREGGIDEALARSYLSTMWFGLADAAQRHPERDFPTLSREYSTAGGLNEQLKTGLEAEGVGEFYAKGLDALLERIRKGAKGRG